MQNVSPLPPQTGPKSRSVRLLPLCPVGIRASIEAQPMSSALQRGVLEPQKGVDHE